MSWIKKTWDKARGKKKKKEAPADEKTAYGRKSRVLDAALAASDDWQAVGQRRRDLIEGQKRFNESELAAWQSTFIPRNPRLRRKRDKLFSEYSSDKYKLN
jgi:hypothetical protein